MGGGTGGGVGGEFEVDGFDVLVAEVGAVEGEPVVVGRGEGDGHVGGLLAGVGLGSYGGVEVDEELALAGEDFGASGVAVAGEDVEGREGDGAREGDGPVGEICVEELIAGAVDGGVTGRQNSLVGEPDVAVAGGVAPAEEEEVDLACAVGEGEAVAGDGHLGALDVHLARLFQIRARLHRVAPAGGLPAIHLVGNALEGEGGGSGGGPGGVAVGVVAVGVGVEDVADGLGREGGDEGEELVGAAGVVGVDDDEVVAHFDDDSVGVAVGVAGEEPDAGSDEVGWGVLGCRRSRGEGQRGEQEDEECGAGCGAGAICGLNHGTPLPRLKDQ